MNELDRVIKAKQRERDKLLAKAKKIDLEIEGMATARKALEGIGLMKAAANQQ